MLSILTYDFPFFKKKEIWFYEKDDLPIEEASYTTYCNVKGNFPFPFDRELKADTTMINLLQSEQQLFDSINTTFKYHIRKAEQNNFHYSTITNPSIKDCRNLIHSFNEFAKTKKIIPINKRRIFALQRSKNILITNLTAAGMEIVTHVYLFNANRIFLLYTFHNLSFLDNKLRGYANKYLHWQDILLAKKMKFAIYDFGGIDAVSVPGITQFKLSFGGTIENANSYTRMNSILRYLFNLFSSLH